MLFALLPLLLPSAASLVNNGRVMHHYSTLSFPSRGSQRRSCIGLCARRKNRKKSPSAGSSKRKKSSRKNANVSMSPSLPSSHMLDMPESSTSATQRPPATLAGITEDHRYEQFFYDDDTSQQLYQVMDLYDMPLLLCNPTLAVIAEKKNRPYKLLDRDTRFNFLSGYESFSLLEPHWIRDYEFDAVFIDPPFANVTPADVARCLRLMAADKVPLWVAYNSRREKKLLEVMNTLDCPNLVPKWRLSYKEGVSEDMQGSIWLYGPEDGC